VEVRQVELLRGRSEVTVAVHVALEDTVGRCQHRVAPDVELPVVDQQWFVQVFLHDAGAVAIARSQLLDDVLDFVVVVGNLDARATVRVLAGLNDPNVGLALLLELFVSSCEPRKLSVVAVDRLHVEGQRDGHFKRVYAHSLEVGAYIHEESLLVRKVVVVFESVVGERRKVCQRSLQTLLVTRRIKLVAWRLLFGLGQLIPALVHGDSFEVVMMLSFAPLRPDKVAARPKLLARHLGLVSRCRLSTDQRLVTICVYLLAIELLLLLVAAIPPGAPCKDLADGGVVVAFANVEAEYLGALLRLDAVVFLVEDFVKFDEEFLVHGVQEVGHLNRFCVQHYAVAPRNRNAKELKQLYDLLVRRLHFLLEEDQHEFVHLVDHLVNRRLCQVFERLQRRLVDPNRGLVLALVACCRPIERVLRLVALSIVVRVVADAFLALTHLVASFSSALSFRVKLGLVAPLVVEHTVLNRDCRVFEVAPLLMSLRPDATHANLGDPS